MNEERPRVRWQESTRAWVSETCHCEEGASPTKQSPLKWIMSFDELLVLNGRLLRAVALAMTSNLLHSKCREFHCPCVGFDDVIRQPGNTEQRDKDIRFFRCHRDFTGCADKLSPSIIDLGDRLLAAELQIGKLTFELVDGGDRFLYIRFGLFSHAALGER